MSEPPCDETVGAVRRAPETDWVAVLLGSAERIVTDSLHLEDLQIFFERGDRVRFRANEGSTLSGTVETLNPKRARVRCGTEIWTVPYGGLDHLCVATGKARQPRAKRLRAVVAEARELMDRHGVGMWALRFSGSRTSLGECRSRQKLILVSRTHALNGSPEQVTDTILHEIAHALAGPDAGHGPAWKAVARKLGATPRSCLPESDSTKRQREAARRKFRTGDSVSFTARGELRTGKIVRMNPKRAKVRCGDAVWSVPYARLS